MIHSVLLVLPVLLSAPLAGEEPSVPGPQIAFQAGAYRVLDDPQWALAGLEYRFSPRPSWWDVRPMAGFFGTEGGNRYVYGGFRRDFELFAGLELSAAVAAGLYDSGTVDLGGPVEFRSGADITWPIGTGVRLGIGFYHLSNAIIYDDNPGGDVVALSLVLDL